MDNDEVKLAIIVMTLVTIVALNALLLAYYINVVLPERMANKGYCWQIVNSAGGGGAYLPCKAPPEK